MGVYVLFGTYRTDPFFLQGPQQMDLHRIGQVFNLVEKQRAPFGLLEEAAFVGHCAGERAFPMPEELAAGQILRYRTAVHRHERPLGLLAALVDQAGNVLLARAAFAANQDGDRRRGNQAYMLFQLQGGLGSALDETFAGEDLVERLLGRGFRCRFAACGFFGLVRACAI